MEKARSRVWIPVMVCCSFWIALLCFRLVLFGPDKSQEMIEVIEDSIKNKVDDVSAAGFQPFGKNSTAEAVSSSNVSSLSAEESNISSLNLSLPLAASSNSSSDFCKNRYVYVHDLPSRFNEDILRECCSGKVWMNICRFLENGGFGPPLNNTEGVFSEKGWFQTNQFTVEVIFRERMKRYDCLTNDSSTASLIYVPFFAGLDVFIHLWDNVRVRDETALALMDWLVSRPEWRSFHGHDHFLVGGRITWAFRRLTDEDSDWGNKLLNLPAMKNITFLDVEASPWKRNDMAVPYPTYFHPTSDSDVIEWQGRMRKIRRKFLFSFAGAARPDKPGSIRDKIMEECRNSKQGKLLNCSLEESRCKSPASVTRIFQRSVFCLQPAGDSPTRRSFFDSMVAGCIPVLFSPDSAYRQYVWFLPRNYSSYSVYIPESDIRDGNVSVEERLLQISAEGVRQMREEVIKLIPSIVYGQSKLSNFKDAFDIALDSMFDRVAGLRSEILDGKEVRNDFTLEEYEGFFSEQKHAPPSVPAFTQPPQAHSLVKDRSQFGAPKPDPQEAEKSQRFTSFP